MGTDKDFPKSSAVSIGEKLRKAREKKSLTITHAQKETRIYSTILTALEEGRCDEILTRTYVRSFLKKYSEYLGLDPKELVKEYAALRPEEPDKSAVSLKAINLTKSDAFSRFIHITSLVLLLIAVLSLAAFLGKKVFFKKPKAVKTISVQKAVKPIRPQAGREAPIPKRGPFSLALKVKEATRVRLKKDSVLLFDRVLPKGAMESIRAEEKVELYIGKGEAIELILNGKSLGSPARGVIKNLEVTSNGIKIK